MSDELPVSIPIDGELDLHTFSPAEVKELVPEYLTECLEREIYELRIVHGKGTGRLRELVHAILRGDRRVEDFRLADETKGGWGATLVRLRKAK